MINAYLLERHDFPPTMAEVDALSYTDIQQKLFFLISIKVIIPLVNELKQYSRPS